MCGSILTLDVSLLIPSFLDRTHQSSVFGETRHYRIFLPPNYAQSGKRYPVIYYLHGHSDRYTLEAYDHGQDTVPKIAAFVATHDVIVVAPDGYVARNYTAFYAGTPYDVRAEGGQFDFGTYFVELSAHIDSTYRTLTSRRFRATSGLSMGGFMSLYLSARFPDLIGSASAFNPGPEFYAGEASRRSLWRPKDHVLNHQNTMIRLVRASGDYISQYHEETREAYANNPHVNFEFRQDEYHRHWATSIAETFDFHMRAFANKALDSLTPGWSYSSAQNSSNVHGYRIESGIAGPGITYLSHVTVAGFGVSTRKWAPDGPPADCSTVAIETGPVYKADANYHIVDLSISKGQAKWYDLSPDAQGRLHLETGCDGHEIGINGPGISDVIPVLLPLTDKDLLRVPPGEPVSLPIRLFNPGIAWQRNLRIDVTSEYPTVEVIQGRHDIPTLEPGGIADLTSACQFRFTAGEGQFARVRLNVIVKRDSAVELKQFTDVLVAPVNIPPPLEVAILDGRTKTFKVFRQRGNQGGGSSIERTVTEGQGNGNGILEPGEKATVWVRVRQGLDPFDKDNWRRAKVYWNSGLLSEASDIQEAKQLEWTSAMNRTSLLALSRETPHGSTFPLILDCEGWSFQFTPDVRFGLLPLYQAFQIHNHDLFASTITYP